MQRPLALLAALLPLLAGCLAAPDASDAGLTHAPQRDEATFTIAGIVQTEWFAPIEGALVTLHAVDQNTTTDGDGRFAFRDVPTGTYLVDAEADGYAPATLRADAGRAVAALDFQLRRAIQEPFTLQEHFRGNIQCGMDILIISGPCDVLLTFAGAPPVLDTEDHLETRLEDGWRTLVGDLVFDDPSQPGLDGLRITIQGSRDAGELTQYEQYARFSGPESFTFVLEPGTEHDQGVTPTPLNATTLRFIVYPHSHLHHTLCVPPGDEDATCFLGVGAGVDISFDLYLTTFYVEAAPAGWNHRGASE